VSGDCRFSAGSLQVLCRFSAGSLQVLCRFSDQGQGFAGSLQLSGLVSGVFRFSAGFLISVRGLQVLCSYPG